VLYESAKLYGLVSIVVEIQAIIDMLTLKKREKTAMIQLK
jgi:hypothetical protein